MASRKAGKSFIGGLPQKEDESEDNRRGSLQRRHTMSKNMAPLVDPDDEDFGDAFGKEEGEEEVEEKDFWIKNITKLTMAGVVVGIILGIILLFALPPTKEDYKDSVTGKVKQRPDSTTFLTNALLGYPGDLFLRALKCVVIPMIFVSMIVGVNSIAETSNAGLVPKVALKWYMSTTVAAATLGVVLWNIFRPGGKLSDEFSKEAPDIKARLGGGTASKSAYEQRFMSEFPITSQILDIGSGLISDNLTKSMATNKLVGIITFGLVFGFCVGRVPNGKYVVAFCDATNSALLQIVTYIIYFTPFGIMSLVGRSVYGAGGDSFGEVLGALGYWFGVTMIGQLLQVFVVYFGCYYYFTKKNPLTYFKGLMRAVITAFGTSSSAATLATTMQCVKDNGVKPSTVNFVLPIGCTVNMDGGANEKCITLLTIASWAGEEVEVHRQFIVILIAVLMSIGSSPVPNSGLFTLVLMLEALDVPMIAMVTFVLGVDFLGDSVRTCTNVCGDAFGAAIVDAMVEKAEKEAGGELGKSLLDNEHKTEESDLATGEDEVHEKL